MTTTYNKIPITFNIWDIRNYRERRNCGKLSNPAMKQLAEERVAVVGLAEDSWRYDVRKWRC